MNNLIKIGQVIPSTRAEGPGNRFAIWVQGCPILCKGCCNPEMLSDANGEFVSIDSIIEMIKITGDIEGISILGGEPFAQIEACLQICEQIKETELSIMVFSGYTLGALKKRNNPEADRFLDCIDLLVDGPYIAGQPEQQRRWIGSSNQQMHFLSDRYSPMEPQFNSANSVEIRFNDGELLVNGWPQGVKALLSKYK